MYQFKIFIVFSFTIIINFAQAQNYNPLLKKYADSLRYGKAEDYRYRFNDSFKQELKAELEKENSFSLKLDSINKVVSILNSLDKKMRIISWVYINDNAEYTNHCVVQYQKKPNAETLTFWLNDYTNPKSDSIYDECTTSDWVGALYYQLYQSKKNGINYYVVLGLDGLSSFSNRKIIDVFWIDKEGELHIGAPLFYDNEKDYTPRYRVFYNYADATTMLLRFEPLKKMITFSNLVPSNPSATGSKQYYIPDGRIDYYLLSKKGKWIKYEGLEAFDLQLTY